MTHGEDQPAKHDHRHADKHKRQGQACQIKAPPMIHQPMAVQKVLIWNT